MAKWLLKILLIAVAYLATGRFGQYLASPPYYATALWPPSGIALACILMYGKRVWPGIFLGALLVNGWSPLSSAFGTSEFLPTLLMVTIIAAGTTVQSLMGATLIRYFVGFPNNLAKGRDILLFLGLGGPVACTIGATVGVGTLWVVGKVVGSQVIQNIAVWWVGDVLGVIVFAPLTLIGLAQPRSLWQKRIVPVAVPLLVTLLAVIIALGYVHAIEMNRYQATFEKRAEYVFHGLNEHIADYIAVVDVTKGFFDSSEKVSRQEFNSFTDRAISRHPGIHALSWLPRVKDADRKKFESRSQLERYPEFQIVERSSSNEMIPAANRKEYFPVFYIEPYQLNRAALGYDVASNSIRSQALYLAGNLGKQVATSPIQLVQDVDNHSGFLIFSPIYKKDFPITTMEERQQQLIGYISGVFQLNEIITATYKSIGTLDFDLRIFENKNSTEGHTLYSYAQRASVHKSNEVLPWLTRKIIWSDNLSVAGQHWYCEFTPNDEFYSAEARQSTWIVLAGGASFTGLLGAFLMILAGRADSLKESQTRYHDLYENAPDMFFLIDTSNQKITKCNQTLLAVVQFSREDIIGRDVCDLFHVNCHEIVLNAFQTFLTSGQIKDLELSLLRKSAEPLAVSLNVSAVLDSQDNLTSGRAILRDVSAIRQAEEQVQRREAELAHVTRLNSMGEMATGLAHEINQPLASISAYASGMAERLRRGTADTETMVSVAGNISSDAHRAGEIIRRLRRFVRNRERERKPIHVNALIEDTAQFIESDAIKCNTRVTLKLYENLPLALGDEIEFQQVVLNLIRNGMDAMSENSTDCRQLILRTLFSTRGEVQIEVEDCGPGIAEEKSDKVFDAFVTSKEEGLGMGLAISRSIVEWHGGRIWVRNAPQGGAIFSFTLPLVQDN